MQCVKNIETDMFGNEGGKIGQGIGDGKPNHSPQISSLPVLTDNHASTIPKSKGQGIGIGRLPANLAFSISVSSSD
jgi:hypothetical protein